MSHAEDSDKTDETMIVIDNIQQFQRMVRDALEGVYDEPVRRLEQMMESIEEGAFFERPCVTHRDVARRFGKTDETIVREWIGRHGLPVAREIGHEKIIRMPDLVAWLTTDEGLEASAADGTAPPVRTNENPTDTAASS